MNKKENTLKLTPAQEATLAQLKETARAKRATYRAAKAAYDTAKQIEREAEAEALRIGDFRDKRTGQPATASFRLSDEDFSRYLEIYRDVLLSKGIDNPINNVYSCKFVAAYMEARSQYREIAAEFLRVLGQDREADTLEKAARGYMREDFEQRLFQITDQFIGA
jgi:hypothetical protein